MTGEILVLHFVKLHVLLCGLIRHKKIDNVALSWARRKILHPPLILAIWKTNSKRRDVHNVRHTSRLVRCLVLKCDLLAMLIQAKKHVP
jgi:hypothetical protein